MISPQQLKKLHEAGQRFLAPLTPYETYVALVEEGIRLSKATWGSVFIPDKQSFKKVYASLPSLIAVRPRKKGTVYKAFSTRKSVIYTKKQVYFLKKYHPEFHDLPVKSAVMIPISYGREAMGVLCLQATKENHFSKELIQILEIFGSMAFICIRKTHLYEQVQKALELRDLFISIASHELKTPLTAATLYSDLLKSKLQAKALPEMKLSESLSHEISRLKRLINDLLQIEHIKKGSLHYEWEKCSMQHVIKEAVEEFTHLYPFYKVSIKYHLYKGLDTIVGDFDKLLQVITNLLTNAARYSTPEDSITVVLEEQDNTIVIHVIDKGKGIPQSDIPNIFEKFYKGENSSHEGMGLGLYLTKNIVDNHGGAITVDSKLHKGTTFSVKLPKYL